MRIDVSLANAALYEGCEVETVAGRANLKTPPDQAAEIVGRNVARLVEAVPADQRGEVVITGPMAIWAHLVVFHAVLHRFARVVYDDGRGNRVTVAAHG